MFYPRTAFFRIVFIIALLFISSAVFAQRYPEGLVDPLSFTLWTNRDDALELSLDKQPFLTELNSPQSIGWTLRNTGDVLDCTVTFTSTDTVTPIDADNQPVATIVSLITIPAQGEVGGTFNYMLLPGTYNAHYPLLVRIDYKKQGKDKSLEAVRVVEAKSMPQPEKTYQITDVKIGGVSLLDKSLNVSCQVEGEAKVELGKNWMGGDKTSSATFFAPATVTLDGKSRSGCLLHPPYVPRGGKLFLEYPITLSDEPGFHLAYGCGMGTPDPASGSDGVTIRTWGRTAGEENELLDECHTNTTTWTDRKVSLEKYAGKQFFLTIEANPGPNNNTTCDSCYISGLMINSDKTASFDEFKEVGRKFHFNLDDGMEAQVELGKRGLLDAKITLGNDKSQVTYEGVTLAVGSHGLGDPQTLYTAPPAIQWDNDNKKMTCLYSLLIEDQIVPVTLEVYTLAGMLVIEVPPENPERIGQLSLLAADKPLSRLFFGHGYVVEKPTKSVILHAGGHVMATSHVAFEYENGPAVLMSTTMPPDYLNVVPEKNIYTLNVSSITKLGLLPSDKGAYNAAFKYRDNSPWVGSPSKGVARKTGRLTFDVWGGDSIGLMKMMDKVFKYGVTDSHLLQHAWQRWGYDVRLPDIWAPDTDVIIAPHTGTIEQLRELVQFVRKHDVVFGLHDNYIDFYPDAKDFSYDNISFSEHGQPNRSWINTGMQAQSYKWRPDKFIPSLERNMEIANRYLPEMDSYFVDVFTSINIHDFFTREGKFVSRGGTRDNWKKSFEIISEYLSYHDENGNKVYGITMSEAGDDFLIGSLDSSDAQWLEIVDKERDFGLYLPCENSCRTPWFTAVNHTNFVRFGAGYSYRYQSDRSRDAHGIMSDDYRSSEILGALCLMVEYDSIYPESIIKHHHAQHVIRHLSDKQIANVEFVDDGHGDTIHRQIVTWNDGTKVYVNKSDYDWTIQDFVLPLFGYAVFDKSGKFMSGIVRNPENWDEVAEMSSRDDSFYLNGRGFMRKSPTSPLTESLDHPLMKNRMSANTTPFAWNGVRTNGAVSVTPNANSWKIVPIPLNREFTVSVEEKALGKSVKRIVCDGKEIPFTADQGRITFDVIAEDALPYEVELF